MRFGAASVVRSYFYYSFSHCAIVEGIPFVVSRRMSLSLFLPAVR